MPRQLALFDFDGTMIHGDSISNFVRFCWDNHYIPAKKLLSILMMTLIWKLGLVKVEKVKSLALSPLRSLREKDREDLCFRFVKEQLVPRIYPDAIKQMKQHDRNGHVVLIVSASPLCYLKHLAAFLPLTAILGTSTDEHFCVERNLIGEEKPRQIKEWLAANQIQVDWHNSYAYGDSENDLPMLRLVGHPLLVNPKRKALFSGDQFPRDNWS